MDQKYEFRTKPTYRQRVTTTMAMRMKTSVSSVQWQMRPKSFRFVWVIHPSHDTRHLIISIIVFVPCTLVRPQKPTTSKSLRWNSNELPTVKNRQKQNSKRWSRPDWRQTIVRCRRASVLSQHLPLFTVISDLITPDLVASLSVVFNYFCLRQHLCLSLSLFVSVPIDWIICTRIDNEIQLSEIYSLHIRICLLTHRIYRNSPRQNAFRRQIDWTFDEGRDRKKKKNIFHFLCWYFDIMKIYFFLTVAVHWNLTARFSFVASALALHRMHLSCNSQTNWITFVNNLQSEWPTIACDLILNAKWMSTNRLCTRENGQPKFIQCENNILHKQKSRRNIHAYFAMSISHTGARIHAYTHPENQIEMKSTCEHVALCWCKKTSISNSCMFRTQSLNKLNSREKLLSAAKTAIAEPIFWRKNQRKSQKNVTELETRICFGVKLKLQAKCRNEKKTREKWNKKWK